MLSYPFVSPQTNNVFADSSKAVVLANPIQDEAGQLRISLLPGLIDTAHRNLSRGLTNLAIFEYGAVFIAATSKPPVFPETSARPSAEQLANLELGIPDQPKHLAGLFLGLRVGSQPGSKSVASGVKDALEAARVVGSAVGVALEVRQAQPKGLHSGRSGELLVGGVVVGVVGELNPSVSKSHDLPRTVGVFEINLDTLFAVAPFAVTAKPIGTFPAATQDLSLIVGADTPAADVLRAVREGAGVLLEEISLTDDYRGANLPEDLKSLTFALRFRAMDRTLTQSEASDARDAGVQVARERFGAEIRS